MSKEEIKSAMDDKKLALKNTKKSCNNARKVLNLFKRNQVKLMAMQLGKSTSDTAFFNFI